MGGMNSGRGRRPNRTGSKSEIGQLYSLNIPRTLKKFKEAPGIYCIVDGKINLFITEHCITLKRTDENLLLTEKIEVFSMSCNYGGFRYFGVCPCCKKKVSALYLNTAYFACRTCLNLCYRSQNRTLSDRLYEKENKIEKKLNNDLFTRPKWMREKTFERLRQDFYLTEERQQLAGFFSMRTIKGVDWVLEERGGIWGATARWMGL